MHYVANDRNAVYKHFSGLRAAYSDLSAFYLSDRLEDRNERQGNTNGLSSHVWERREIENYLCQPATLIAFAHAGAADERDDTPPDDAQARRRAQIMDEKIRKLVPPIALSDANDPYWRNVKASDDFLDRLFENFYQKLNLSNQMRKTNYHRLARHVAEPDIAPEIRTVLDGIHRLAQAAKPF